MLILQCDRKQSGHVCQTGHIFLSSLPVWCPMGYNSNQRRAMAEKREIGQLKRHFHNLIIGTYWEMRQSLLLGV